MSFLVFVSDKRVICAIMATGGIVNRLPASAEDITVKAKTSQEEPWCFGAADMYKARVWEDLRDLFQQDELTDVMLAAEGQSIPCHRVLLAAASKFFHGKFVVNPESLEHNILDIEGIEFDTLTSVVSYIYSGHVALTVEKTEKLIPASVSLMLPELNKVCKDFLYHKINNDTSACIDINWIARVNSLTDLAQKSWQVMLEKFEEVSHLDSFKEMPQPELQVYIRDERLNIASQDPVFEAVVTWVRHDMKNRKRSFERLIKIVKLSHCTPRFLGEVVKREPLMKTVKCMEHLADAMYQHITTLVQHGTARRGSNQSRTLRLIAIHQDEYWTLKDGESEWVGQGWAGGKKLGLSGACMTADGILVTGGQKSKKCWKLTIPTLNWTPMPDLFAVRYKHAAVPVGNKVYVLGGEYLIPLQFMEYLDEQNRSWHECGKLPFMLYGLTACSYKHFIYVFGGLTSRFVSDTSLKALVFDTNSNKWSWKADMPEACWNGSSVMYRDKIYVLGSRENCCMSYHPAKDQWKTHSKPAVKHIRASAVVWKDRILLCGGEDTSVIEEYNPETDTWSRWKHRLPRAEVDSAVFAIHM